jgi:hypothetical protein
MGVHCVERVCSITIAGRYAELETWPQVREMSDGIIVADCRPQIRSRVAVVLAVKTSNCRPLRDTCNDCRRARSIDVAGRGC